MSVALVCSWWTNSFKLGLICKQRCSDRCFTITTRTVNSELRYTPVGGLYCRLKCSTNATSAALYTLLLSLSHSRHPSALIDSRFPLKNTHLSFCSSLLTYTYTSLTKSYSSDLPLNTSFGTCFPICLSNSRSGTCFGKIGNTIRNGTPFGYRFVLTSCCSAQEHVVQHWNAKSSGFAFDCSQLAHLCSVNYPQLHEHISRCVHSNPSCPMACLFYFTLKCSRRVRTVDHAFLFAKLTIILLVGCLATCFFLF